MNNEWHSIIRRCFKLDVIDVKRIALLFLVSMLILAGMFTTLSNRFLAELEAEPSEIYFFENYDVKNETLAQVWNAVKNHTEILELSTYGDFSVVVLLHVYATGGWPIHSEWWVSATTLEPDGSGLIHELVLRLDHDDFRIIRAYASSVKFNPVSPEYGAKLIEDFINQDPNHYWIHYTKDNVHVTGPFLIYFCQPADFGMTVILNLNVARLMIVATGVWDGTGVLLVPMEGDLDRDGIVDITDVAIVAKAFGSRLGDPRWNPAADLDGDKIVDIIDVASVARKFGSKPTTFVMKIISQRIGEGVFGSDLNEYRVLTANAPQYSLPINLDDVVNFDTVRSYFNLGDKALQLLKENGFVVIPWRQISQFNLFYDYMYYSDVPIFVSADSMLHTYHVFFDELLRSIEEKHFIQNMTHVVNKLVEESVNLYNSISTGHDLLKEALKRNVCFFSVAAKLLNPNFTVPTIAHEIVTEELALIESHDKMCASPLFGYEEDYSQYVPRGHYTRSEALKRYFKAMMWLGRMRFMVKTVILEPELAKIQTVQAVLITRMLDGDPAAKTLWEKIYLATAFFVGFPDDLTIYDYEKAIVEVYGEDFNLMDLEDEVKLAELQIILMKMNQAKIISSPIYPWNKDELVGLRFMGQRYIPDSYIFQELVFDKLPNRYMPKGLDVMAVFGSDRAEEQLSNDKANYLGYEEQLAKLQDEFSQLTVANWTQNLYWSWLHSIESTIHETPAGYPTFMRTNAWLDEKLNTALGSWTELRHDTILYAKQSYTVMGISFPLSGYVEPLPQFYSRLIGLSNMTINGLKTLNLLEDVHEQKLTEFCNLLNTLIGISIKELRSEPLSDYEVQFIKEIGFQLASILEAFTKDVQESTLVADVHTDLYNFPPGWVLEEACGYIDVIIVVYKAPDGRLIGTAGPIFSYYEFAVPLSQRLTDEAWIEMVETGNAPPRPEWIYSFHA